MTKGVLIDTKEGKRVVKGLGYYETPEIENLKQLVKISTEKHGDAIAFRFKDKIGNITGKTYNEFDRDIDCLGTALISLRLKGMNYSIISENRYEWGVCYLAVTNGSGIAVPLDKYLPENEVETLVQRGKVDVIFYSPSFHDMMVSISNNNKRLKYFICMEKLENMPCDTRFQNLPELISKGNKLLNSGDKSFVNEKIDNTEMSVLLFTSGTTSISKGVMLSHKNIVSNVVSICATLKAGPGDVHLSLLPLHHTFENTVGFLFMVYAGVCIAYCDGIKHIAQNLKEYNISLLVAVPAVFETFYRRLTEGIKKSGKEKLVESLIKVSGFLRSIGIDLRRKLFKSIFDQFAPKLTNFHEKTANTEAAAGKAIKDDNTCHETPERPLSKYPIKVKTGEFFGSEIKNTDSCKTMVLQGRTANVPYLQSLKNPAERIIIDKSSILVGRLAGSVDYVIDNNAVGKMHAEILKKDELFYIIDLNSVNGTFVNGERIVCNTETIIKNGDKITLANEVYKFTI
jgi:acyl-CoA synthetase (AMP-forming)/AMP-acid ligase II